MGEITKSSNHKIFRNLNIKNNLNFTLKFIVPLSLVLEIINMFLYKEIKLNSIMLLFFYILQYLVFYFLIEKKLVYNLEEFVGVFIFIITTLLFCFTDYQVNSNLITNFYFQKSLSQVSNLICFAFIQHFEKEVFCKLTQKLIFYIYIKKFKKFDELDNSEIIDSLVELSYSILLSFVVNRFILNLFNQTLQNFNKFFSDISLGMDKLVENTLIISFNDQKIKIKHCSPLFKEQFTKDGMNSMDLKFLLQKFKKVEADENFEDNDSSFQSSSLNDYQKDKINRFKLDLYSELKRIIGNLNLIFYCFLFFKQI